MFAVVGKQARVWLGVAGVAHGAGAAGGKDGHLPHAGRGLARLQRGRQAAGAVQHVDDAFAVLQRARQAAAQGGFVAGRHGQGQHGQLDGVFLEAVDAREGAGGQKFAIHAQVGVAARARPFGQFGVNAFAAHHQRGHQADGLAPVAGEQLRGDAFGRLRLHGRAVVHAVLHAQLHVEQAQKVPDLGDGAHGGFAPAAREALLDGDGGRYAVHGVHIRAAGGLHDAAGVGVQAFQIAALAFAKEDVEGQRGFAAAAHTGDDAEFAARNANAQVLQVVLAGVDDFNLGRGGCGGCSGCGIGGARFSDFSHFSGGLIGGFSRLRHARRQRALVFAQRRAGVRMRAGRHFGGRALRHDAPARLAAFGAEVNQPVAGAHHVQVVFDDDDGVPRLQQLTQRAHELGDVVKVQAAGRLVKQKQRAFFGHGLARPAGCLRGFGQVARQFQALRLAAAERGHGLAQLHVVQPHIHQRLQGADDVAVLRKKLRGFGHGEFQHVGHVQRAGGGGGVGPAAGHFGQAFGGSVQIGIRGQAARGALYRHFQHFGPPAAAVAVGAAQIHVAQKLHFHVLEAAAAAGGAAAIAAVEAEFGGGVAALARQRRGSKELADGVPRAHVAGRVGARRFADGRLIDEHYARQLFGVQQALVRAGRFGGLAKVAQQRRGQHVLNERGFARAAHARHRHQPLQGEGHIQPFEVVLARAFQNEPGRAVLHGPRLPGADALAPAQILAGERIGLPQLGGRAVKHDAPACRAGAGAKVQHAVGGQHHGRVVLHHHQRVARALEALHGAVDARHVARVQADTGFIQHKQRVHQRSAQRRGEVDALHFAAAQGAALPVQREVVQPHVRQVLQARADFVQDELARLRIGAGGRWRGGIRRISASAGFSIGFGIKSAVCPSGICAGSYLFGSDFRPRQPVCEHAQALDGQLHHVMQAQARQAFKLLARPGHAVRHEALRGRQHGIGVGLAAHAPQERFVFEARAAARLARGVAAVFGQQHADVHLVGLALQILEKAPHAVPLPAPVALAEIRRAFNHPLPLLRRKLRPGRVARNTRRCGVAHQILLALLPRGRLNRLDGPGAQAQPRIRHHQPPVHANHPPEAPARLARAHWRVEGKHRRRRLVIAPPALRAMQPRGKAPEQRPAAVFAAVLAAQAFFLALIRQHIRRHLPAAAPQRHFNGLQRPRALGAPQAEAVGHHIQHLAPALLPLGLHPREAAGR